MARLTNISTRVHAIGASLVIVATEPVAYLTSRPDPLTVLVDLRDVGHVELSNLTGALESAAGSPIANVAVEATESMGSPVSRVRVSLAQPVLHRASAHAAVAGDPAQVEVHTGGGVAVAQ